MKCPVCKIEVGGYYWPAELDPPIITEGASYEGGKEWHNYPLYQFSYPDQKEYLSPRCSSCFDKAMRKRERKVKLNVSEEASQGY